MWVFKFVFKIKDIYLEFNYLKYMLNIVNEYYFCVMYVKYEFLEIVIKKKFLKIRYVFWVKDFGKYFDFIFLNSCVILLEFVKVIILLFSLE